MTTTANTVLVDDAGRPTPYFLRLLERLERLPARLAGSKLYEPGTINAGAVDTTTVPVSGAALGMQASASFSLDQQGVVLGAWVSASDVVSVLFHNPTGGNLTLGFGNLRAYAWSTA